MPRRIDCKNRCGNTVRAAETKTGFCRDCLAKGRPEVVAAPSAQEQVAADRTQQKAKAELSAVKAKYAESLKTIELLEKQLGASALLNEGLETFTIEPRKGSKSSEATAVLVASDWHVEENVGAEVGGLNRYNVDIATERATRFFQSGLRLINLLKQDVQIPTIVLALLGDFISGNIHDEVAEVAEVPPTHAIVTAQNLILSGIEFLLANSDCNIVLPCHSGNHARTTKTTRFATENGHSLEYLMYLYLAAYFRKEPRVQFIIPEGMHSYLDIYDTTVRFQHGHAIKYGGGVGGIYVPVHKAIAQWNRGRHADLDVFGHFHQQVDGGNFLCNGSLIGMNSFALSIKASYEKPKQTLFLLDRKRGKTCTWPILVE